MADFYDCSCDQEELTHTDWHDAVEYYLDQQDTKDWPDTLTVYAWTVKKVAVKSTERWATRALEALLEEFDEEYGPSNEPSEATEEVAEAARAFVNAVVSKLHVWQCERSGHEDIEVNVAEWVREHNAYWLEQPDVSEWVLARETKS